MNNVQEVLDTLEEALFFNTDVEDEQIKSSIRRTIRFSLSSLWARVYTTIRRLTQLNLPSMNEVLILFVLMTQIALE